MPSERLNRSDEELVMAGWLPRCDLDAICGCKGIWSHRAFGGLIKYRVPPEEFILDFADMDFQRFFDLEIEACKEVIARHPDYFMSQMTIRTRNRGKV